MIDGAKLYKYVVQFQNYPNNLKDITDMKVRGIYYLSYAKVVMLNNININCMN